MIQRITRVIFQKRRRVEFRYCWLRWECAAYFETGVIDCLPDECPNRPMLLPMRHHRTHLQGPARPRFWAMCARLGALLCASPRH